MIAESDTISRSRYGERNDLLKEKGWTRFKKLAEKRTQLKRMTPQCQLKNFRSHPSYKLGVPIPKNHGEATRIDTEHGDQKWKSAEDMELKQMKEYGVFRELDNSITLDKTSKEIKVHFVYDVKQKTQSQASSWRAHD